MKEMYQSVKLDIVVNNLNDKAELNVGFKSVVLQEGLEKDGWSGDREQDLSAVKIGEISMIRLMAVLSPPMLIVPIPPNVFASCLASRSWFQGSQHGLPSKCQRNHIWI